MRYRQLFAAATFVVLSASCMVSEPGLDEALLPIEQKEITIIASLGEPDTRTERAADGSVLWSPGDQISLFYGSGTNGGSCFTAQNTETAKTVNFTGTIGVITGGNNIAVEDTYFWAVYPYNATASCDGTSITTVLPAEQVATADTFADDLFPSMGRSQGLNMSFYNICGGIKFTVSEEDIKSVTLKANGGEQIVGAITAAFDGGVPVVTNIANGSDTITLTAPEGETFEVGKSYFFVMVPTVFESGFTLTFSKGYARAERVISSKATIKRSVFGTMNTPDAGLEWEMVGVYMPDANFRAYMIQHFDTDGNDVLDFDEAEAVASISVTTDNIESLEGIAYCSNLQSLDCYGNSVSWNTQEQRYVGTGKLCELDVHLNTGLTRLICYNNQLVTLDVSANTALTSLSCGVNQLTELDVSTNTLLTRLACDHNKLTTIDVSNNTLLTELNCYYNQLTNLDISNNTAIKALWCGENGISSLYVNTCLLLAYLDCSNCQLTSLDVSANTALTNLRCNSNMLSNLQLSNNIALTELWNYSNQLTNLDVSANTALTDLRCYGNQLTSLNVSANTALTRLYCYNNQLTSLDISKNTTLSYLDCSPMKDNSGQNCLGYLYISQGQSIPNVTTDRSVNNIPDETIILVAPETGGSEGTIDEPLD